MAFLCESDLGALAQLLAVPMLDRAGAVVAMDDSVATVLGATQTVTIRQGALSARRKTEDKATRDALSTLSVDAPAATVCLRNRESHPVAVVD